MDAGSYRASFPAPSSHLPLAKTTELCKTLFHSCRLPFPSEFAHFLFQFLIKLKQKAAKKRGGNANYTAPASLHSSLSLSLLLLCLLISPSPSSLPRSELDWSSASSLWNHLPATAAGEKHQLLILHTNGKLLQQTCKKQMKLYIFARFPSLGCGLIVSHLSFDIFMQK